MNQNKMNGNQVGAKELPLFSLGMVVATAGVANSIPRGEALTALDRHHRGDWGSLSEQDCQENEESLTQRGRLLSVFDSSKGIRFWIITEADRSVTTILLPSEY